jgi:tRNA pseudouridine55 synthase
MLSDYRNPDYYLNGAVLLIDKAIQWTSFDVVNKLRKDLRTFLGIRKIKVGHAGTLDPLASGLVIICTGRATKQIQQFQDLPKTYEADLKFGATTPSFDLETMVDRTYPWEHITVTAIEESLKGFTGIQEQDPPIYSAKSIGGKRAYEMARKGKTVNLQPVRIEIHEISILSFEPPVLKLRIRCSKGTYIRALARDIGTTLDSGAHLIRLRRLAIGEYSVKDAISTDIFEKKLKQL